MVAVAVGNRSAVGVAVVDSNVCRAENEQEPGTFCQFEYGHPNHHMSQISSGVYVIWP